MRLSLLLLLLVLGASASAQRTVVTTEAQLRGAIAGAQPGDTIALADGRWTDLTIDFYADGVEGDSVRLEAETPGGVILDGESSLNMRGEYLVVDGLRFEGGFLRGGHVIEFRGGGRSANHSRVTNVTVVDFNNDNANVDYKWVSLYGVHNRVDHSYFAGKTHSGALLVVWLEPASRHEPTFHRIDNNHFGPRRPFGRNGAETIRIGTSDTSMQDAFVTVERNLFEECSGEAEIISNKSGRNTYRGNTFVRSRGSLTLRHGNGALVEGNFFFGQRRQDTGGVRVIGEDHVVINNYFELMGGTGFESAITIMNGVPNSPLNRYFQVKNVIIAHNTIARAREAITLGAGADSERTLAPENVVFHNNVILSEGNTVVDLEDTPTNMTWDGTLYFGGGFGIDVPPGVTNVNPLIEPTDGDAIWRPLDNSPVFDAAQPVPGLELLVDVDGQPRDATPDIGADERSDAPITRRPLTPEDVGPAWFGIVSNEPVPEASGVNLGAPFPNPARGAVTIPLSLDASADVEIVVIDALGRRVAVVARGPRAAGTHDLRWAPEGLAPGLYSIAARSARSTSRTSLVILP